MTGLLDRFDELIAQKNLSEKEGDEFWVIEHFLYGNPYNSEIGNPAKTKGGLLKILVGKADKERNIMTLVSESENPFCLKKYIKKI